MRVASIRAPLIVAVACAAFSASTLFVGSMQPLSTAVAADSPQHPRLQ